MRILEAWKGLWEQYKRTEPVRKHMWMTKRCCPVKVERETPNDKKRRC